MTDTNTATVPAIPLEQMTPAQAAERLTQLQGDKEWTAKLLSGDGPPRKEFDALVARKSEVDRLDAVLAGKAEPQMLEVTSPDQVSTAKLIEEVRYLREGGIDEKVMRNFLSGEPIAPGDRQLVERYQRELLGNAEFVKRYLAGDYIARKEMTTIGIHLARPLAEAKE